MLFIISLALDRKYRSYFMTYKFFHISAGSRIASHQDLTIDFWEHEFVDAALIEDADSSSGMRDSVSVGVWRILIVEIKQSTRFSLGLEENWFLEIVVMKTISTAEGVESVGVVVLVGRGRPFYSLGDISGWGFAVDLLHPLPFRSITKLSQITNHVILLLKPLFIFSHNQI